MNGGCVANAIDTICKSIRSMGSPHFLVSYNNDWQAALLLIDSNMSNEKVSPRLKYLLTYKWKCQTDFVGSEPNNYLFKA